MLHEMAIVKDRDKKYKNRTLPTSQFCLLSNSAVDNTAI